MTAINGHYQQNHNIWLKYKASTESFLSFPPKCKNAQSKGCKSVSQQNNSRIIYLPEAMFISSIISCILRKLHDIKTLKPNVICRNTLIFLSAKGISKDSAVLEHLILQKQKYMYLFKPLRKDSQKSIFHTSLCVYNQKSFTQRHICYTYLCIFP